MWTWSSAVACSAEPTPRSRRGSSEGCTPWLRAPGSSGSTRRRSSEPLCSAWTPHAGARGQRHGCGPPSPKSCCAKRLLEVGQEPRNDALRREVLSGDLARRRRVTPIVAGNLLERGGRLLRRADREQACSRRQPLAEA